MKHRSYADNLVRLREKCGSHATLLHIHTHTHTQTQTHRHTHTSTRSEYTAMLHIMWQYCQTIHKSNKSRLSNFKFLFRDNENFIKKYGKMVELLVFKFPWVIKSQFSTLHLLTFSLSCDNTDKLETTRCRPNGT